MLWRDRRGDLRRRVTVEKLRELLAELDDGDVRRIASTELQQPREEPVSEVETTPAPPQPQPEPVPGQTELEPVETDTDTDDDDQAE